MPAANQLQSIFEYIATDNRAAAYRTVRRIREAILRVALMPYSGRIGRTREPAKSRSPARRTWSRIELLKT
jgi:plasmid stabilization system protein ParE